MIVVGLVGVVVPVLPGLLLVWGGVALWALERGDATGWTVLAVATVLTAIGSAVKYVLPGRRLRGGPAVLRVLRSVRHGSSSVACACRRG